VDLGSAAALDRVGDDLHLDQERTRYPAEGHSCE
jgi:hypothetical protein